jgi:RimJ/RimL family protein N-acetyltransferase
MEYLDNYIVKRLDSNYRKEVLNHFIRLDKDSRYTRFCSPFNDFAIEKYVAQINFEKNGIFGVFDEDLNIIGVGECVLYDGKDQAEVGFSVEKNHQGHGLGSKLMERIVRFAKSMGKHHLEMVCLRTNSKSIHLAKKFGLKVQSSYEDECVAAIDTKNLNPALEVFTETVEDSFASYNLRQRKRMNEWKKSAEVFGEAVDSVVSGMIKMITPKMVSEVKND